MIRILVVLLLLALPASAYAADGDPDRAFGRRGTVTLKANADAAGFAVNVVAGNRILAGGSADGKLVLVKLRATGSLDRSFGTSGQVVPALPGTSLDGFRSIQTFRDGRIVASGTLRLADGTTRIATLRLLPTGEIDPSFGAGAGYTLSGPVDAQLAAMAMDKAGNIFLAGESGGAPLIIKLLPDGSADPNFAPAALGLPGRATGLLIRAEGTISFTVAAGPATFTVVRLGPTGAPDPAFGGGTGVVNIPLGPGSAPGIGAIALRNGPGNRTLVAGTDLTTTGRPRGAAIRLNTGTLDTRFGAKGYVRVSRAGRDIRITSMTRDSSGRILLAGTGAPPDSLVVRLRANGARDTSFGNGGLTYPVFGQPPGGTPIYTRFEAIDAAGSKAVIVGSAAGPGSLVRSINGTSYTGRFALTVSRLR